MINEERLRPMVKMAIFDKNEGKACKPTIQYAREDYISWQLLRSFVTGSIAYVVLCLTWVLYDTEMIMKMLNGMYIFDLLKNAVVLYAAFIVVYLTITYIVYQVRYTKRRRQIKLYYENLKDINKIYDREEKLKSPSQQE